MTLRKRKSNLQKENQQSWGKISPSKSSVLTAIEMRLEDDNEDEKAKIKALPLIDSSADLIKIDDIEADENDSRSTLHFLSSYLLFM